MKITLSSRAWLLGACTFMVVCLANVAQAGMVDAENANNPNAVAAADATTNAGAMTATAKAATQASNCEQAVKDVNEALEKGQDERAKRLKARKDAICKQQFSAAAAEEKKIAEEFKPKPESNLPATSMGADARNQNAYNPPQNIVVSDENGKNVEISWAKYESFRQIGESKGFSDEQIAGIAGRLQVESYAFSPTKDGSTALGDGGTSSGKAQWHKERGTALVNYINEQRSARANANNTTYSEASLANNGKAATGLKFSSYDQNNYVFDELPKQMSKENYAALKNATSAEEAARIFTKYYERPASAGNQAWGLAGGNNTYNFATGLAKTNGNAVIPDTGQWGSRQLAKYESGSGVGTGGGNGGSSGSNAVNNIISQMFGSNGSSLLGGGSGNPIANALNSLLGGGGGGSGSGSSGSSSGSESTSGSSDSNSEEGSARTLVSTETTINIDGSIKTVQTYSDGLKLTSQTAANSSIAAANIKSYCGATDTNSSDAFMLMIDSCIAGFKS